MDLSWVPTPFEVYGVTPLQHLIMAVTTTSVLIFNLLIARLMSCTQRPAPDTLVPKVTPAELCIVLGSGGHTAEMLNILRQVEGLQTDYRRMYIVSSGDGFSAGRAADFEKELASSATAVATGKGKKAAKGNTSAGNENYTIHTGLLTTPFTTLRCMWDCMRILRSSPPDLIVTNGPGTGVCVVLASVLMRMLWLVPSTPTGVAGANGKAGKGKEASESGSGSRKEMRTTFIESWARVKTLSLSGKILVYFVDRFVVQWPRLVREQGTGSVEYRGPLVR
ncbi:UDP-N-acetylglucosamine transferase subunit alg14 [Cyphellophora attinorum]|uniref:UDP-N-acetylglucosamine transferase subunit ALG14 n=1 Tax=Cyphellophora attinorum TaxID=1664694 RepID=A0A0N1GZI4_9EURO|nr:UDP-N-acetylglucosamine transferase subunit alg14 [Phialophora attinorum]KPI36606.1 UDP-N-acetylglucosamine transferase subunit alg14 [Phialophora attinorum]